MAKECKLNYLCQESGSVTRLEGGDGVGVRAESLYSEGSGLPQLFFFLVKSDGQIGFWFLLISSDSV